jgi:hypothetical protein
MLSRFIMNLYERDRKGRAQGLTRIRTESALTGARGPWGALAAAHDLAFDDEGLPALRGLLGGFPFQLEGLVDREGFPFMLARLSALPLGALLVEPRSFRHRFWLPGSRASVQTQDPAFDAAYGVRGHPSATELLLRPAGRAALLGLHYRSPRLEWRGSEITLELSGIELDFDRLIDVVELLRVTPSPTATRAYR